MKSDDWESVVVLGRYVEIPNAPEDAKARECVRSLLRKRSLWRQSGYTINQVRRRPNPAVPVYYCILIEKMTGLRAHPTSRNHKNVVPRRLIDDKPVGEARNMNRVCHSARVPDVLAASSAAEKPVCPGCAGAGSPNRVHATMPSRRWLIVPAKGKFLGCIPPEH
jgi:hypothetical protein